MKDLSKINKALSKAGRDIWESAYIVGGQRMKRDAKRSSKRAHRRANKALIKEQIG